MLFKQNKKKNQVDTEKNWRITRKCLDFIFECAKSNYPNEFGGMLRVDQDLKNTIVELVILPGTISGNSHAIFRLHMLPIDFSIVGTVHSHPTPNYVPSNADLSLFQKKGRVHIITGYPFNDSSWSGYNSRGEKINIEII